MTEQSTPSALYFAWLSLSRRLLLPSCLGVLSIYFSALPVSRAFGPNHPAAPIPGRSSLHRATTFLLECALWLLRALQAPVEWPPCCQRPLPAPPPYVCCSFAPRFYRTLQHLPPMSSCAVLAYSSFCVCLSNDSTPVRSLPPLSFPCAPAECLVAAPCVCCCCALPRHHGSSTLLSAHRRCLTAAAHQSTLSPVARFALPAVYAVVGRSARPLCFLPRFLPLPPQSDVIELCPRFGRCPPPRRPQLRFSLPGRPTPLSGSLSVFSPPLLASFCLSVHWPCLHTVSPSPLPRSPAT